MTTITTMKTMKKTTNQHHHHHHLLPLLLLLTTTTNPTTAQEYYPDWQYGSGTCLENSSTPAPLYMRRISSYFEPTIESCCKRYYDWEYPVCLVKGGGVAPSGSNQWFVDYSKSLCVKDCPVSTSEPTCGGLATPVDVLYDSAGDCCENKLKSLRKELCATESEGQSYGGSNQYYRHPTATTTSSGSSSSNKCVQDCSGAEPCGGIVVNSYTKLYATMEQCCSGEWPSMDAALCLSNSSPTSTGTGKWYKDSAKGYCLKDSDVSPGKRIDFNSNDYDAGSITLYDTFSTCCSEGLGYVTKEYCESRSDSSAVSYPYSEKWFVDYTAGVCRKDCGDASDGACSISKGLTDKSAVLFDTAGECCASKLSYLDKASCEVVSMGGAATPNVGTTKWYDAGSNKCQQDCDTQSATCTSPGGILISTDTTTLYDNVETCCSEEYNWMNQKLCQAMSTGSSSNLFYVDYPNKKCTKDCPTSSGDAACGGPPLDYSTTMYDTAESCCSEKLAWIREEYCIATSNGETFTGSELWYVDYSTPNTCTQDCDLVTATCTSPGGILEASSGNSLALFPSALECCKERFSYIDESLCVALGTGGYTNKFYANIQTNSCIQDCDGAKPCGPSPTDLSVPMYDTAEECCMGSMGWIDKLLCVANTNGVAATGSDSWWMDWSIGKCVKDCPKSSSDPECGGLKNFWDATYSSASECCSKRMSWKELDECTI